MLQKLKSIAEDGLEGQRVADCVIGVPSYWTEDARRAMLDAAYIAGLNVLRLMNETTAVALNYGILRPLPKDEARKVMFVDCGLCSTSVSIVSFVQGKLKVEATASDAFLGGRDFDKLLVDHFDAYIQEAYKMAPLTNPKSKLKMYKECERVKMILSANTKVNFNVEYLMNDTDVKGEIDRATFEDLCNKELIPRLKTIIDRTLAKAGISATDLFAVEIVGGTSRIPIVQAELEKFFGKPVSKTCDCDESVARGCALQCAMLSPSFRVREFEVQDITPYAVDVQWGPENGEIEQTSTLFTVNNSIPSVKMISFKDRTQPFQLMAKYTDSEELPANVESAIGRFVVSGMPAVLGEEKAPKIKVRVKMNVHGLLEVTSAQLLQQLPDEPEASAESKPMEEDKPGEKKEEAAEDKKTDMDTSADEPKKEEAPKKEEEKEESKKKRVKREDLKVTSYFENGLGADKLQAFFEREVAMANQDKAIAETLEARNSLESYVLEMRSQAEDDLKEYFKDAVREKFCEDCTQTEYWLEEDGWDAQKSEYKKRLAELKAVGDAAVKRQYEAEHREEAVGNLKREIGVWETLAASTEEKYAHIEEADRKKVTDACTEADRWLAAELSKQDKLTKADDPVVTVDALGKKLTTLKKTCSPIMNKPKPPPPKPATPEKKEDEKKDADDAATADAATADAAAADDEAPAVEPESTPSSEPQGMEMD